MIPPTFTEETKKLLEEAFTPNVGYGIHCTEHEDLATIYEIESFLLSRTQEAYNLGRAETLKEVREHCDEIRTESIGNGGLPSGAFFEGMNYLASSLITRLTQ